MPLSVRPPLPSAARLLPSSTLGRRVPAASQVHGLTVVKPPLPGGWGVGGRGLPFIPGPPTLSSALSTSDFPPSFSPLCLCSRAGTPQGRGFCGPFRAPGPGTLPDGVVGGGWPFPGGEEGRGRVCWGHEGRVPGTEPRTHRAPEDRPGRGAFPRKQKSGDSSLLVTCSVSSDGAFSRPRGGALCASCPGPRTRRPVHSGSKAGALMEKQAFVCVADGCAGNLEAPQ